MSVMNRGFFIAADAATISYTSNSAILEEIAFLEKSILDATNQDLLSLIISNSPFTSTILNSWTNCDITEVSDNFVINLASHGFLLYDQVEFGSSDTLPSPIVSGFIYYIHPIDNSNFAISSDKINTILLADDGVGQLQVREITESEKYQFSYEQSINYPDYRIYNNRINRVKKHFSDLGYNISIISNSNNNGKTFCWSFSW